MVFTIGTVDGIEIQACEVRTMNRYGIRKVRVGVGLDGTLLAVYEVTMYRGDTSAHLEKLGDWQDTPREVTEAVRAHYAAEEAARWEGPATSAA